MIFIMIHFMRKSRRILALSLALLMLAGCGGKTEPSEAPVPEIPAAETSAAAEIRPEPEAEASAPETEEELPEEVPVQVPEPEAEPETEPEPEPETEVPEPEPEQEPEPEVPTLPPTDELLEEAASDISGYSDDPDTEADLPQTSAEPAPVPVSEEPAEPARIFNYLNGRTTTEEERSRRPVAIMLNNLKKSLPQEGLCSGDIYYECAAEGGITRLMMLVSDYENLGTVGSIRSSRDYFVDFLANHDALYVHAGGSEQAYAKINWRGIENMDGVNMYLPNTFWRDTWRMNNIGYEHSMMTSGEGIVAGIKQKGYRTELDKNQVPMFNFYDENTDNHIVGSPAPHVHMISTSIQTVDFVYNEETGEYLRYQYNGLPHKDGTTGEQLSVKNVIILFTDISLIPGDAAGRLSVGTVGSGQGYYITNGKRKVINWSRETKTSTVRLEYKNGDELILNSGKTFICVVDDSVAGKIDFEYNW